MTLSQRFVISHPDEAAFKTGGLRDYSAYRDLGVAGATGGLAHAHVIRMTAPFRPELGVRHHHNVQFQMVYCLKAGSRPSSTAWGGSAWLPGPAGCSRRASGTPSSAGPTTASCCMSSCPPSTRR
jgi:hypothetical protein